MWCFCDGHRCVAQQSQNIQPCWWIGPRGRATLSAAHFCNLNQIRPSLPGHYWTKSEALAADREELNALYVAMTRARTPWSSAGSNRTTKASKPVGGHDSLGGSGRRCRIALVPLPEDMSPAGGRACLRISRCRRWNCQPCHHCSLKPNVGQKPMYCSNIGSGGPQSAGMGHHLTAPPARSPNLLRRSGTSGTTTDPAR